MESFSGEADMRGLELDEPSCSYDVVDADKGVETYCEGAANGAELGVIDGEVSEGEGIGDFDLERVS